MYRLRDLMLLFVCGGLLFGFGVWTGQYTQPETVQAQSSSDYPNGRYGIYHNSFGPQSFYALKIDRQTGEVWVLSANKGAGGDEWVLLPEKDKRKQ